MIKKSLSLGWVAALSLVFTVSAAASNDRRVAVTGECSRSATPDRGEITVVADFLNKDIKSAIRDATQAYERTRDAVKKLKLADMEVETSEYNVHEVQEWQKDHQVSKGFQARMGLKVSTSSVDQLGQVIAVGAEQGLKDVGQLRMFLSDEKLNSEKGACLKTAAEHARSKAKELASALGAKIGKVYSIREEGARLEPIRPMVAMMRAESSASLSMPAPQVEGGKQQVSISVEAVFELE